MVAITLATLLLAAIVSVFVGSRSAYQSTAGVGELSDSGRFALDLIGETARSGGNLACNSTIPQTGSNSTDDTLLAANALGDTFTNVAGTPQAGVAGYEANATGNPLGALALTEAPVVGAVGNWTPNLDAAVTGTPGAGPPVQGSDVLVLRSSVARVAPVYATALVPVNATTIPVTTPLPNTLFAGQYAAISDCTKSVSFQIAGVGGGAPAAVNIAAGAIPVEFAAGALVQPISTTVYYVGVGSDGLDGALWRLEQVNSPAFTAEELVPGVENMQVLYGIDTTGLGAATQYVTADQIGVNSVVSIQVAVLAASPAGTTPTTAAITYNLLGNKITAPADHRLRKMFYATISLRSAVN
jgi:type IV pilus assembly protein PilW